MAPRVARRSPGGRVSGQERAGTSEVAIQLREGQDGSQGSRDAEREGDSELAEFFRRAQAESRKGAEQGKERLGQRLAA
jgi:hypothetical protein